jgi:hypothetical protein
LKGFVPRQADKHFHILIDGFGPYLAAAADTLGCLVSYSAHQGMQEERGMPETPV